MIIFLFLFYFIFQMYFFHSVCAVIFAFIGMDPSHYVFTFWICSLSTTPFFFSTSLLFHSKFYLVFCLRQLRIHKSAWLVIHWDSVSQSKEEEDEEREKRKKKIWMNEWNMQSLFSVFRPSPVNTMINMFAILRIPFPFFLPFFWRRSRKKKAAMVSKKRGKFSGENCKYLKILKWNVWKCWQLEVFTLENNMENQRQYLWFGSNKMYKLFWFRTRGKRKEFFEETVEPTKKKYFVCVNWRKVFHNWFWFSLLFFSLDEMREGCITTTKICFFFSSTKETLKLLNDVLKRYKTVLCGFFYSIFKFTSLKWWLETIL